ncbi:hypothetical protein GCM10028803_61270 [Larkinella knui]|uniref:DUF5723 domain-containing protein n=1 Tax=Larkinella knui TaxID=2025310 RepID=A0A3P1CAV2_9BACT|nr:DUF5723 family protein [Larkinella knui]RRB10461.1 hypothetical protein EHT87_30025 [Larkinella knui]
MGFRLLRFAFLFFFTSSVFAQNFLGVAPSSYGGTQSIYLNPAFATDSKYGFYFNIGAGNAHLDNNYVRYKAPFSLTSLVLKRVPGQYKLSDGAVLFRPEYLEEINNGKRKNATAWTDLRGPSLMVQLGDRAAIGLTTRLRATAQIKNASESLMSVVRAGLEDEKLYNIPSRDNLFNINTNTYAELGLTLAAALIQNEYQQLSVGVTVKRLQGITAGYLRNNGLSYRVLSDTAQSNSYYMQVDQLNADLGYTTYLQDRGRSVTLRQLFDGNNPGRGWGADLGFSYQLKSADNPADYAFRLGVAITDLGSVRYRDDQYVQQYSVNTTNQRFTSSDFNNASGSEGIADVLRTKLNLTEANNRGRFTSGLPTALSVNADINLGSGLYVTGTILQDLRSKDAISIRQPSLIAVTPRLETSAFGVAIPLVVLNNAFMAGASIRVGPVFLGTDNLFGMIGSNSNKLSPRGADVYAGLAVASLRRKP